MVELLIVTVFIQWFFKLKVLRFPVFSRFKGLVFFSGSSARPFKHLVFVVFTRNIDFKIGCGILSNLLNINNIIYIIKFIYFVRIPRFLRWKGQQVTKSIKKISMGAFKTTSNPLLLNITHWNIILNIMNSSVISSHQFNLTNWRENINYSLIKT